MASARDLPINRRQFISLAGCTVAGLSNLSAGCSTSRPTKGRHVAGPFDHLSQEFSTIEARTGGRLGVAAIDTQTAAQAAHRADERFPMCSTFKLLAVAATLARVDAGADRLDRAVPIGQSDIVPYSPVTQSRVGQAMPLADICEAAMTASDNTAANLLLQDLGGPAGLTAYARALGDTHTRLDRVEPFLNEAVPGDPRDTTTPAAMLADLRALTLENALLPASRSLLIRWLMNNKTGAQRLRAGLPPDWQVGDKTGSGANGTTNDVGVLWPPDRQSARTRQPVLVCAYLTESTIPDDEGAAVIASIARAIAAATR